VARGRTVAAFLCQRQGGQRLRRDIQTSPRTGSRSRRFLETAGPTRRGYQGCPDETFVSMGNYLFSRPTLLVEALPQGRRRRVQQARHGRQILPMMVLPGHGTGLRLSALTRCPRPDPADAGLLAGRWNVGLPTTTRTWTLLRCRADIQPVQQCVGRFSPNSRHTHRRSS